MKGIEKEGLRRGVEGCVRRVCEKGREKGYVRGCMTRAVTSTFPLALGLSSTPSSPFVPLFRAVYWLLVAVLFLLEDHILMVRDERVI